MTEKTEKYLLKLKAVGKWNDEHDYSLFDYINRDKKAIIILRKYNTKHLVRFRHELYYLISINVY